MTLAAILTTMALAAAIALAWPLIRRRKDLPARAAFERALYRDQLDEVDRDLARGVISAEEAGAARAEIERRALTALDRDAAQGPPRKSKIGRTLATTLIVFLPAAAGLIYFASGRPDLPDLPFAQRKHPPKLTEAQRREGLQAMMKMVTARLQAEPRDGRLWALVMRVNRRIGHEAETKTLYRDVMKKAAGDSTKRANIALAYGEALVNADQGVVSPEAKAAFDETLKADPGNVGGQFYRGLWLLQSGDAKGALRIWVPLERAAPKDAPYLDMLKKQIKKVAEEFKLDPKKLAP